MRRIESFRLKMRCALGVDFIYNSEGHGKIVIKSIEDSFYRAAKKDSATT
jgi:hypothetical protein